MQIDRRKTDIADFKESDVVGLSAMAGVCSNLLRPPQKISLADWADKNRILPADAAVPGKWQTKWAAPAPEVYEAFSDPTIKEIIVCCSTQMMKSEFLINALFYVIEIDPAPILLLQPDKVLAEDFAEDRIKKSAEVMDYHRPYLAPSAMSGRRGNGTKMSRPFPGGRLYIKSTEQKSALISYSLKYIFADEINKFKRDIRGQLRSRQTLFPDGKIVFVSSVGAAGECRITSEWERGDRREWQVPCADCGTYQVPKFKRLRWDSGKPETAVYVCEHCQHEMTTADFHVANRHGSWIAERPCEGIASFKVNAFAHPNLSLAGLVREYIDAQTQYERLADDTRLRDFFCDRMSENYQNASGTIEPHHLSKMFRMDYPKGDYVIPADVNLITMTVDVQGDRLECDVTGWGYVETFGTDNEILILPVRYGLEYFKLFGDPSLPNIYHDLEERYDRTRYTRDDGLVMGIYAMGIDSGGHNTEQVANFVKKKGLNFKNIFPLKGGNKRTDAIFKFNRSNDVKMRYLNEQILVGTFAAKDMIFAQFLKASSGEKVTNLWNFPERPDRGYDDIYFAGLTSEKQITRMDRDGVAKKYYVVRGTARNEPLDLAVYQEAMVRMVGIHTLPVRKKNHEKIMRRRKAKKKGGNK